ncbi:DUF2279 domain-containing protein [Nafulsella turpanensis]|uniref:DUF2279 domain-containing protein n=1 Tax=Nafulsella turpanensis TaxID=1265690 RepID=UPI00034DFC72|nr:DUF2279 domain-containing protein [Nafulsella turpanensis]
MVGIKAATLLGVFNMTLPALPFFKPCSWWQGCLQLSLPLLFLCLLSISLQAQQPDSIQDRRMRALLAGGAAGYTGLLFGLNALWYSEQDQSSFHFFNDNRQWMLVDKSGHAYSSFHLSRIGAEAFQWAGLPRRKAQLYGSLGGWLLMTPVEILDGFSAEYGASWGDVAANSVGSLLYAGQHLVWEEVRIKPKFSFHTTPFAAERPGTLGHTLPTQILKDYNGQTYWLAVDLKKFLPDNSQYPKWLHLAFGYGTTDMVYALPESNRLRGYEPLQQWYLAPDIDLSHLKGKRKWLNGLIFLLEGLHLPAPALEWNRNGIRFHPLYF